MKAIISLVAAIAAMVPMVLSYDEKFDRVDADMLLALPDVFDIYLNCWLDKGPCLLQYAHEYKDMLPEIIATNCAKCTPKQRQSVRKFARAFLKKDKSIIDEFWAIYDPYGQYREAYVAFAYGSD